uniref:G_PROTEIN_RECEP_F1_2 domain-containing protein n=1 Tax=Parastrongyloides trichosuri TaxID=131310 RepID=A0A0N4ZCS1_PARTI
MSERFDYTSPDIYGDANKTIEMSDDNILQLNVIPLPIVCKILAVVLYTILSCVAFIGNLIIIVIILYFRRLTTGTNMLIMNLAIADIMIALICMPFSYWHVIIFDNSEWVFGSLFCKLLNFFQATAVFSSSWTLVAISFDRCLAILFVMSRWNRLNKKRALYVIAVIWIFSLLMACPLYFANEISLEETTQAETCVEKWNVLKILGTDEKKFVSVYNKTLFALQYCMPLLVLVVTYTIIGFRMWYSAVPGADAVTQSTKRPKTLLQERHESVKKLIPMVILISALYAGCWLPQNLLMNVLGSDTEIITHPYILYMWWISHTIAMFHSVVNPFIYYCQNKRMREGLRYVLRWLPCVTFTEFKLLAYPNQRGCCSQKKYLNIITNEASSTKKTTVIVANSQAETLCSY